MPIVVGALGPKMRNLGATIADGVLLSWLTPAFAEQAMAELHRDSAAAGREARGSLYVRAAVDAGALPLLRTEAGRYESYPMYAANFRRLGVGAADATIDGTDQRRLRERLGEYSAVVDEVVLRVIALDASIDSHLRFVDVAAEALG
jgi:alkanesulfonate monooxygenase SsuD/methylene tetrahydromethanopterin reductase-like flavin-dependent oxidoreductase (luciferase family)